MRHTPQEAFRDFEGDLPASVDRAAVERMRTVATLLDSAVRVPGTEYRIGIDPLVGVIPGVGDVLSAGIAGYILLESAYLGVSVPTLLRMLGNIAVDLVGGSIPYAGVLFDAVWKANQRNLVLALTDLGTESHDTEQSVRIDVE